MVVEILNARCGANEDGPTDSNSSSSGSSSSSKRDRGCDRRERGEGLVCASASAYARPCTCSKNTSDPRLVWRLGLPGESGHG